MRNITELVVHCSDSPDDRDIGAEEIHQWHIENEWDGIAYHEVIRRDGRLEAGRPDYWVGAHVYGHNSNSLGVCLIGGENYSDEQISTLVNLLVKWRMQYADAYIVGHYELDSGKTCPNIDMRIIRDMVEERLESPLLSD